MRNKTVKYTAGEIGGYRVVRDFLPSPDALVAREDNVKVTLGLSRRSVEFFKRTAKRRRVAYQRSPGGETAWAPAVQETAAVFGDRVAAEG